MNKKITFFILLAIVGLLGIFIYNSITSTAEKELTKAITEEFSTKYDKSPSDFIVTVDTDFTGYAKGSMKLKEHNGGGIWFAAVKNGKWQLVYDGNGIIPCADLLQYPNFPSSLIPQCFDDNQNMLINR